MPPDPAPALSPSPSNDPTLHVNDLPHKAVAPSLRLLFSPVSPRHRLTLLLPAVLSSIAASAAAPFTTLVIGAAFQAFARFPHGLPPPGPTQADKDQLLHAMAIAAFELIGLAVASVALSSLMSSLWIWTGEQNAAAIRRRVYAAVTRKDMAWFDAKAGPEHEALGAGGLMAKFSRETDEVREASSLAAGRIIQYLATALTCLGIAFSRSWALTLVILSAVPLLILIQSLSQIFAGPLLHVERTETASAATHVERAVSAIGTVKAFNAQSHEQGRLGQALDRMARATMKLNALWSLTSGLAQFVMMGMFVQAFWFGSTLVKNGKIAPGDVMTVFWACLIATSNLQMSIPQFIVLSKGKFAMASLLSLAASSPGDDPGHERSSSSTSNRSSLDSKRAAPRTMRKIRPKACEGELSLNNVSFAYPSRPGAQVLHDVSLFLPAHETTFIVGASGSGKSTIAHLLLGFYQPQRGKIEFDDQDVRFLDEGWRRANLAAVDQNCMLFDLSVYDNVALGASPYNNNRPVTQEQVKDACVTALMHEFVRDLPDGYDTMLGTGGASLSGGQRQRLALARARLRDPAVLILDEATSALDPTSRILVFEALKRWRKNKTTIVITHDLAQVSDQDFVYVLKAGRVVEQGYRSDLQAAPASEFAQMLALQAVAQPESEQESDSENETAPLHVVKRNGEESSLPPSPLAAVAHIPSRASFQFSRIFSFLLTDPYGDNPPLEGVDQQASSLRRQPAVRRASRDDKQPLLPIVAPHAETSNTPPLRRHPRVRRGPDVKQLMLKADSLTHAPIRRQRRVLKKRNDSETALIPLTLVDSRSTTRSEVEPVTADSTWGLLRTVYPTVPYKPLVLLGLVLCLASGAMTPVFSFLLSQLFFEVAVGAQNTRLINEYGFIVLGAAGLDGLFIGLKYFVMESTSVVWLTRIRKSAFRRVLGQDKKWFDQSAHAPSSLIQVLIKDGEDARNLVAVCLGQVVVVTSMLSVGLVWALVMGWQLTLAGAAIAPVFAGAMAVQSRLVANCELRNKRAREDVAKRYYEAIVNIRGIRAMGFEAIFQKQFDAASARTLQTGVKGAFVEGCTYGVASGLIYLAEALLFYVGAVLVASGTYSYLQMVQVMNLVVFTVTIGSQLMAFTQKIAQSVQATRDFTTLLRLPSRTDESTGHMRSPIHGHVSFGSAPHMVTFQNVHFAYPGRPDAPVLQNLNLDIFQGECVAVVGASGSGKSTIAALLQRLYEPQAGRILLGRHELFLRSVDHLRENVSVVSQTPQLFDASVADNIAYGSPHLTFNEIRRAAQAANAHDFIMALPHGYDTMLGGDNATLLSGGQAQRLCIARALARPSKILILDECTSALDAENQALILSAIQHAKVGRTTLMITHKLPVMQLADRILVVHEGRVAEAGRYEELVKMKGVFSQLARGGEWE